jgi:hypothetical protein
MLRPLDLVIALWLALQTEPKTQLHIAAALGVAQSNVSRSLAQLERSGLLRAGAVQTGALLTLLAAVRMVFPAELGRRTRGLATAADGPATADRLVGEERTVWPDDGGAEVGTSLAPLHPCVVQASRRDAAFYEVISLVELLRTGRVREVALARELLEARLVGAPAAR